MSIYLGACILGDRRVFGVRSAKFNLHRLKLSFGGLAAEKCRLL
ncbi:hypothetical protein QUA43_16680 [Microcoleus sp. N9_B4]